MPLLRVPRLAAIRPPPSSTTIRLSTVPSRSVSVSWTLSPTILSPCGVSSTTLPMARTSPDLAVPHHLVGSEIIAVAVHPHLAARGDDVGIAIVDNLVSAEGDECSRAPVPRRGAGAGSCASAIAGTGKEHGKRRPPDQSRAQRFSAPPFDDASRGPIAPRSARRQSPETRLGAALPSFDEHPKGAAERSPIQEYATMQIRFADTRPAGDYALVVPVAGKDRSSLDALGALSAGRRTRRSTGSASRANPRACPSNSSTTMAASDACS